MMRVTVEVRPELGIGARNRQPQAEGDRRFKLLTKLCKKLPFKLVFYYINHWQTRPDSDAGVQLSCNSLARRDGSFVATYTVTGPWNPRNIALPTFSRQT